MRLVKQGSSKSCPQEPPSLSRSLVKPSCKSLTSNAIYPIGYKYIIMSNKFILIQNSSVRMQVGGVANSGGANYAEATGGATNNGGVATGSAFNGDSFEQIWRGRAYMDFRRQILTDRKNVDMCRNCSEGYRGMFSLVKEIRG